MRARSIALVALVALAFAPGCTLIGAAAGGGLAAHSNHEAELKRARAGDPEGESSILPGVVVGAGLGLIVDALVVSAIASSIGDSTDGWSGTWGYGWSND